MTGVARAGPTVVFKLVVNGVTLMAGTAGASQLPSLPTAEVLRHPAIIFATTMVAAVVIHLAIQRRVFSRVMGVRTRAEPAVTCVLQRDDELESRAETSPQRFAIGARVTVGQQSGTVLDYDEGTQTYSIELETHLTGEVARDQFKDGEIEQIRVKNLFFYPIKSCGGIPLEAAMLTPRGILHDREWMFTNEKGKLITQRRYSTMALIRPRLVPDIENPTTLVLAAQGMPDLEVPILLERDGVDARVSVWDNEMLATDQGDAAANWINTFLADVRGDHEFRLVRTKASFRREVSAKYAPNHETGFADDFPVTVIMDTSLEKLNENLAERVLMNRFRPSIVLTGAPAFADDHWNCVTIEGVKFRNVRPISRCNLPCVNQKTAEVNANREPTNTLLRLRNGLTTGFLGGKKDECFFGSHLVVERTGSIRVGAPVKVLSTKQQVHA